MPHGSDANNENAEIRRSDSASAPKSDSNTAAPSRSEIESALSGRTKRNPQKPRPVNPQEFDLNVPPRRQQVIGGNLSGVSNKPSFGIFSRYSNVSITNWVALAIVLLILLAFFWPAGKKSTLETTSPALTAQAQLGETDLSPDEQNELIARGSADIDPSFSRPSDIERAAEFRSLDSQELQIRALLDQAKTNISKGQLLKPEEANALSSYRAVLAINPRNIAAKEGIDYLKSSFLNAGYSALETEKINIAQGIVDSLNKIDAGSDEYLEFRDAVKTWKNNKKISQLLTKANKAFKADSLILPARNNALYFFQQALNLDKTNETAIAGVKKVADAFVGRANEEIIEGNYQAASAHLATVSIIDSNHESISLLEKVIARAKPLAEKAKSAQRPTSSANPEKTSTKPTQVNTNGAQRAPTRSSNSTKDQAAIDKNTRTPSKQTNEQQAFDRQYLKRGLEAYYKGEYDTAGALLQPLADKGIARAQFRLAYMHYLGRGFDKNTKTADGIVRAALPAIQKFANDGRAWAQSDLGSLYEDGLVLKKDYDDAVKWDRLAAEQGYPGAQTNLGLMYARGRGVTASRSTAVEWFQRAAKQGDSVAQRNLKALGIKP